MAYEIERKYLICLPERALLEAGESWEIQQTYLTCDVGNRRVRKITYSDGRVAYIETRKMRKTAMTCLEEEREISEADYLLALRDLREDSETVCKVRYRIPYAGQILEIDVYPFWDDTAVLEVELESEDTPVDLPPWVQIKREVTEEPLYKNTNIARWLHDHPGVPLPI